MIIHLYPDELDYVNAKLHPASKIEPGAFLKHFLRSCVLADDENYELLRPAVAVFMQKYPADAERLRMEQIDRGAKE